MPAVPATASTWDSNELEAALVRVARFFGLTGPDRDDWMQDARLHALQHRKRIAAGFRGEAAPSTYLHTVVRNHCLNWIDARSRRANPLVPLEDDLGRIRRKVVARLSVDVDLDLDGHRPDRLVLAVRREIAKLSEDDRILLLGSVVHELQMAVLARRLGCSRNAAYRRLYRILARLKVNLAEYAPHRRGGGGPAKLTSLPVLRAHLPSRRR
jgi:RNA polymerase sigma-70 factor (ECF subfamily)